MLIYYSQRCHPATGWTSEFQLLKELGLYFLRRTHAVLYYHSTTPPACLPAAARQHRCCRCILVRPRPSLLFGPTRSHPYLFYLFCFIFLRPYKLCRKTIANQNSVPCSVALSNLLYGTTTSLDRHVLGYHITPDNEPITNSSLK